MSEKLSFLTPSDLNDKQKICFQQAMLGSSLFISGPGGVGKSYVLDKIKAAKNDSIVVGAPTGIAALNVQGSTLHRMFGFPIGYLDERKRKKVSKKAQELFKNDVIKTIAIDELSMVRADMFEAIDNNLRIIKGNRKPFGGLQIIGMGDFYQIPPVVNTRTFDGQMFYEEYGNNPFAFSTKVWEKSGLQSIELTEIVRQNEKDFIFALNSIRRKDENYIQSLKYINAVGRKNYQAMLDAEDEDDDLLVLCATNAAADSINETKYAEVEGEERFFDYVATGEFKDEPVPKSLRLKIGCKVLICANNAEADYYNGDRGIVTAMTSDFIAVETDSGRKLSVVRNKWVEIDYDTTTGSLIEKEVGSFTQFPIKMGWAITIHKSQGMTLPKALIYTGNGCFVPGQAYVGLSRLKSLSGLIISHPIRPEEIMVHPDVTKFYNDISSSNLLGLL